MSDQDYNLESPAQLIPPQQSAAASGMGLAPVPPPPPRADTGGQPYAAIGGPGVKVNSRGQPYSTALENMPPNERANMEAATAAARAGNRAPLQRQGDPALPPFDSAAGQAYREQHGGSGGGEYPADLDQIIIAREGSGDNAISPKGAVGRNQIMPSTAALYGVGRDQLFDREKNMELGNRIRRDLWNKYHDKTAVMVAYNAGPGAADRWLASGRDPNVLPAETRKYIGAPSTLSDSWGATLPPELRESLDYSRAARGKLDTLEAEFLRRSQQAVPGSADRHQEMDRLRTDIHHATEEWMALTKRPPVEKPVDMWQNFGSPATIVAMLGGLFARHHLSASLNAAGLAMQAINTNNHQQFKQQWDTWKTETEYGLKLIDLKQREIDDILKDDKLAWDRKMAEMKTITDLAGMTEHSAALARSDLTTFAALNNSLTRGASAAAKGAEDLDKVNRYQTAIKVKEDAFRVANPGVEPTDAQRLQWQNEAAAETLKIGATGGTTQGKGREADVRAAVDADVAEYKKANPSATDQQVADFRFEARRKRESALGQSTHQPRNAPAIALQKYIEEYTEKNGTPPSADQIQSFHSATTERTAEARAVGNRSAGLEMAANAAEAIIPLLEAKSAEINRTEFPDINRLILAAESKTGDPKVVQYGELMNSMRYLYARALSPTGQARVADIQHFDEIMNPAWSKGQVSAGLQQIRQSIEAERGAIAKTREEVRGGGVPAKSPVSQLGADHDHPATPASKDDYLRLPKGAWYKDADGQVYQKQSDAIP